MIHSRNKKQSLRIDSVAPFSRALSTLRHDKSGVKSIHHTQFSHQSINFAFYAGSSADAFVKEIHLTKSEEGSSSFIDVLHSTEATEFHNTFRYVTRNRFY